MSRCLAKPYVFLLVLTLFAVGGCITVSVPLPPADKSAGSIHSVEPLDTHSASFLRLLVWWGDLPERVTIFNGVRMYRVEYWTTDPHGAPTVASGLVAMPKKPPIRAVVSYQHGTTTERKMTPSKPTLHEGVLGSALFAGAGYLFCATDYIGLGTSCQPHPYLHADTEAKSAVDLMKAAKKLAELTGYVCPPEVYLVGFSQGGHATMALQRMMESMQDPPFSVAAAASAAGAYDLANKTVPFAMEGHSNAHSLYLAWCGLAYSQIYNQPLQSLLKQPYAGKAPLLFDGEHNSGEIMAALPRQPRDMFTAEFLDAFDNKKPHWFIDALEKNETFRFTPKAPVRLYYGACDIDVPPCESKAAEAHFKSAGANATAVNVGPYEHDISIFRSVPKVRAWFDEMTKGK